MQENFLKKRLQQGEKVLGTWSMSASPIVVNAIAEADLDFVIIDMEHGPMSFETMGNMVMAAECAGSQAIIRVADASEQTILRALETGCQAIMVPHVSTAQEAASVVRACKYAP
ncbi:MAG: siderophore biosynthesis protein SbnG, partial [Desulfobulbaceae bacterium]|nr:siderophore biosynthesis protein SbnG [Desulfobulbaceae bacterium]